MDKTKHYKLWFQSDEYILLFDKCRLRNVSTLGISINLLLPQRSPARRRIALCCHDRFLLML